MTGTGDTTKPRTWLRDARAVRAARRLAPSCMVCARAGGDARVSPSSGFPDDARRGVAVHQRRADRRDARSRWRRADAADVGRRSTRLPSTATRRLPSSSSSTAGSSPELSRRRTLPRGRDGRAAWPRAVAEQRGRRRAATSAQRRRFERARRSPRSTRRFSTTAPSSTCRTARVVEQPIHLLFVSTADRRGRGDVAPARADRRRRAQPGARSSRATSAPTARRYFTNAVTEVVARRERRASITTRCSARARRRSTSASMHVQRRAAATSRSHAFALGGALVRNDVVAVARRRGRRVHAERPVSRPTAQRLVDNHTTIDHAKPHCASRELYKGILGGTRARRLQRQDHRPPGRAEDRRQADQPEPAALGRRADRHQAAARDLRRRREVHARRGGRPARRRGALLPARARARATRGARHC